MRFRKLKKAVCFLISILLTSVGLQSDAAKSPEFSWTPGSSWLYKTSLRWVEDNRAFSKNIIYKMTVKRIMRSKNFTACVVSGFPGDLVWFDGKTRIRESVIISTRKGKVFAITGRSPASVLKELESAPNAVNVLAASASMAFQEPLKLGAKITDPDTPSRKDDLYCWVVDSVKHTSLKGIKGVAGAPRRKEFELSRWTNSDDTHVGLIPGIGINHYSYHHHGTANEVEMRLIELH